MHKSYASCAFSYAYSLCILCILSCIFLMHIPYARQVSEVAEHLEQNWAVLCFGRAQVVAHL